MNSKSTLLAVLCLAVACNSWAQQLYKSVGPDGKVTFSDQPSKDEKAKISIMRGNVLKPVDSGQGLPDGLMGKPRGASRAEAPKQAGSELELAVLFVMTMLDGANRFERVCSIGERAGKDYSAAATGWRQRNANFIDQQSRILTTAIAPSKRAEMQRGVATRSEAKLAEVSALGPQLRGNWCQRHIQDMGSGVNDVANNSAIAVPLITYKP